MARHTDKDGAEGAQRGSIHIRTIGAVVVALAAALALALFRITLATDAAYELMANATDDYLVCLQAANDLQSASDNLMAQARLFVVTHDVRYARAFFDEELRTQRREAAVQTITDHLGDVEERAALDRALAYSNELTEREHYAMLLVMDAQLIPITDDMAPLKALSLLPEHQALSAEEKLALGQDMLLDDTYQAYKDLITQNVQACTSELIADTRRAKERSSLELRGLLLNDRVLTFALLAVVVGSMGIVVALVMRPLERYTEQIGNDQPLRPMGAHELRYLAEAYNAALDDNLRRSERLRHEAEHDPLTGLLNRGAYDALIEDNQEHVALLLIDVDQFKGVNDQYGHEVGDAVLKRVGGLLLHAFRSTDHACRVGGDEFAVIMTGMSPELAHVVEAKVRMVAEELRKTDGTVPVVTLSVGIAFSDGLAGIGVYKAADEALYLVKERGRDGYAFYGEGRQPDDGTALVPVAEA